MVQETEAHYSVMVNGKLRGTLTFAKGTEKDTVIGQAQILIAKWLEQKTIIKIIFIQDRTVNFVIKD